MKPSKEFMAKHKSGFKHWKIAPYGTHFIWGDGEFLLQAPKGYYFTHGAFKGQIYLGWFWGGHTAPGPWLRQNAPWIFDMEQA